MPLLCILETQFSANKSNNASQYAWRNDLEPQDVERLNFFEMNTIETATNNFSLSNKLGQGGFGSVYKVREYSFFLCYSLLMFSR